MALVMPVVLNDVSKLTEFKLVIAVFKAVCKHCGRICLRFLLQNELLEPTMFHWQKVKS